MTLLSLVIALLLEQLQPLQVHKLVLSPLQSLSRLLVDRFNDGQARNGRIAWILVVLGASVLAALVYYWLWQMLPALAFAFNVGVLYLTMGFRQESHFYTEIHLALRMEDLPRARQLLAEWRGGRYDEASSSEVARLAIEQALVASHRNVFAIVFWFIILPGPSGAVMYRLARFFHDDWGRRTDTEFGRFGEFARRAFDVLDWLPARITSVSFSVVGDFEDAVYCWRTQANQWPEHSSGILIASGAGALGVRLGMPIHESGEIVERPEMGTGDEAGPDYLQRAVGLIWRALLLCLMLLALVGIAAWVGA